MIDLTEVVVCKQIWVLGQRDADPLLLLVAAGVGDLDVASFGGRFIDDFLQFGIQLAVQFWRAVTTWVVFVPSVTAMLCWDFIQNLGFRLLLA